ncbi:DUF3618 domain-containing protein [Microvirga roseola]|uniref:DUF3618 domain-containing protein n=1 Tax=Microvirga roseola TaxID=2883126 RepID=UPI001E57BF22|nr:DUF3618 domain-containing protein [Microvirga roseola]
MTQSLQELERDIEHSRAKLDQTIDRLQDRMSVSGVIDDFLGTARSGGYAPLFDHVLETVRRNPIPVMLIAAGIGLLAHRVTRPARPVAYRRTRVVAEHDFVAEEDVVMEPGDPRIYGAGASTLQSGPDEAFERRRSMTSRI